jgi:hypothetical protein
MVDVGSEKLLELGICVFYEFVSLWVVACAQLALNAESFVVSLL